MRCIVCQRDDATTLKDGVCGQCNSEVVFPFIHRNGTSAATLYREADEARDALVEALKRVEAMTPNQRDYYPVVKNEPRRFHIALHQYQSRVIRLKTLIGEVEKIVEHLGKFE